MYPEKPTQLATLLHTHWTGEPGRCGICKRGTLDSVKVDLSTGFVLCSAFWAPKTKTINETQAWSVWHLTFFFFFSFWRQCYFFSAKLQNVRMSASGHVFPLLCKRFCSPERLGRTVLASGGACDVPRPGVGTWPSNFRCFQQTLSP